MRSLADELIRQSGDINVYVITYGSSITKKSELIPAKSPVSWSVYGITIAIVGLVTVIDFALYPFLGPGNLVMVYLLGIIFVALFGQFGPSILASILSVLAYDFFFILPQFSFAVTSIQYFFTLPVMLILSLTISHLTILSRRQTQAANLAKSRISALHTLSRKLASTRGVDKLLDISARYLSELFDCETMVLLPKNNYLEICSTYKTKSVLSDKDNSVAQWAYDLGQMAGLGTDTLPFSEALYVPLLASQGSVGVLRVCPIKQGQLFTQEQIYLLEACAHQIGLALEVDRLQEQTKRKELKTKTDQVRNKLLQSVSHDLRTPLVAIIAASSTLKDMGNELDVKQVKKISSHIYFESEQLNRLINNLLQITYLESGAVKLQKELRQLNDIIRAAIDTLGIQLKNKTVQLKLPANLPKVPVDYSLMQAVFINLIENAVKFTPPETVIEIVAIADKNKVIVRVEDQGPGIVADEVDKLFKKFYRGRMLTTERGLGLGLAICQKIIKSHGGKIWAENRKEGGAAFCFSLPLNESASKL